MLVPQGVSAEAAARHLLEPQEVWREAAAQFDPVKGALVVKQGLFECLAPTVSFSEKLIFYLMHVFYYHTIITISQYQQS